MLPILAAPSLDSKPLRYATVSSLRTSRLLPMLAKPGRRTLGTHCLGWWWATVSQTLIVGRETEYLTIGRIQAQMHDGQEPAGYLEVIVLDKTCPDRTVAVVIRIAVKQGING